MYYFIGIKGTGMAALAGILHDIGNEVRGSDLATHFFTQDELDRRNIVIDGFEDEVPSGCVVIIGNAFDDNFPQVKQALSNSSCTCYRYHEFVGVLMKKYLSISVAGSHGKTTTTTLLSTMLDFYRPTGYIIGDGTGKLTKDSELFVVESCEFRCHFLKYFPQYAIITNADLDHVDYFKSHQQYYQAYEDFALNVKDKIVLYGDDIPTRELKIDRSKCLYYGLDDSNDIVAKNLCEYPNHMTFDLYINKEFKFSFDLPLVGIHMLNNALACIGIGYLLDMPFALMNEGLNHFKGAKRRYVIEEIGDCIYIDDYAHHPTEVDMTIKATRKRFPGRKIVAIFKPHRASRVQSFVNEFAAALGQADVCAVCDFTSIDDFDDGSDITIEYLTDRIEGCYVIHENDDDVKLLSAYKPCVYLFMSSKDIYHFANKIKEINGKS
ncbi:MAG: Mur ligase family protein [Erysipelotrichaceae bacterium]